MKSPHTIILAVADGHGNKKNYLSDVGSKLAVETAREVCGDITKYEFYKKNQFLDRRIKSELCKDIVKTWIQKVYRKINEFTSDTTFSNSHQNLPETSEELSATYQNEIKRISFDSPDPNLTPYGTTIIITVITQKMILFLQLGDGDILTVSSEGIVRRPLPADERLLANETTSLCLPNAWNDFRIGYVRLGKETPALILASTDGYSNSFADEEAFRKVGNDILELISIDPNNIQNRIHDLQVDMNRWLSRASEYSGDDVTLGIICNLTAIEQYMHIREKQSFAPDDTKKTDDIDESDDKNDGQIDIVC